MALSACIACPVLLFAICFVAAALFPIIIYASSYFEISADLFSFTGRMVARYRGHGLGAGRCIGGARSNAEKDPIGNLYRGTTNNMEAQQQGNKFGAVGGETKNGWKVHMNNVHFSDNDKTYNMGGYPQLVSHEFLHLMGQDDKGGTYYDKKGRMVYTATRENDFKMKDISAGDVKNILKYAQTYGANIPAKKADHKDDRPGAQVILKEEGEGNFKWGEIQNVQLDKK